MAFSLKYCQRPGNISGSEELVKVRLQTCLHFFFTHLIQGPVESQFNHQINLSISCHNITTGSLVPENNFPVGCPG